MIIDYPKRRKRKMTNEVKKTCYNYTLTAYETEVRGKIVYYSRLENNNAKKEWNKTVELYYYSTAEARNARIEQLIKNITAHNERKAQRRAEKKAMTNHAKIGDILVNSWGYDQTNTDFYQVVRLTKKGVYIKQIGQRLEYQEGLSNMAGYTYPLKDYFLADKPEKFCVCKSAGRFYSVAVDKYDFQSASLTDPQEKHYCSWYA